MSFELTNTEVILSFVFPTGCDASPSQVASPSNVYQGLLSGLPESYLLPVYTPKWREALS